MLSSRSAGVVAIRAIRHVVVLAVLASASTAGVAHVRQKARPPFSPIEPGKTFAGELSPGGTARLSLTLAANQSVWIVVAHRNIDVIVRLLDVDGKPDLESPSEGGSGEVRLRMHAIRSGTHAIEIAAAYPKAAAGRYTVRIDDVRRATDLDRRLSEADRHQARARRLRSTAAFAPALSHAEQAFALRQQALGPEAPAVGRSLLLLAQLNDALANFGVAEGLYVRARRILERAAGAELALAETFDSHAGNNIAVGRFPDAEALVKEALAIRERILGPGHFLVAVSLGTLADLHHESAKVQEARIAADRALEIAARSYGPAALPLGDFLNRVARAQLAAGHFASAEKLYRQTFEVSEANAGGDSLAAVESLAGLARVALLANDNVKAEKLHVTAIAIKEKIFGPDHPQVATDLSNLALIHYRRRDYTNALAQYERALVIWEKALGGSHPLIARTLNNLGLVYWRQLDYKRAEEFFQRSFELSERLFGPHSLRIANSLGNLGIIAKETGDYVLAETRYQRALAIKEKHVGTEHPDLITLIESLGILYRDRGDYTSAEKMFQRTLGISEVSHGPEHPFVARHLDNVAHLNWAMGRWETARAALQRTLAIEERNLRLNLAIGSERQKLAYFEPLLRNLEEAISFHLQQPKDDPAARDMAITTLLQRKGRILDALGDTLNAFRQRAQPEDRALLDQLTRVAANLAAASVAHSTALPIAERRRRTATLAAERERLEIEIHRRSAGYLEPSNPLTLAAVRNAVPADAALLEFAVYRPFDPRAAVERGEQFGAPRYVAYVVRHGVETRWKDLGPAGEIDRIIDRFRLALADPARPAAALAGELHHKLIAPLQPLLGEAKHLLVSPDGALNLIPFEALRGAGGRYVVEDVAVSYVTTGRDLVRMRTPRPAASGTVVFADPAFGEPPAQQGHSPRKAGVSTGSSPRDSTGGKDRSPVYFAPLAGTASEAQRIGELFPGADLKLGPRASERALKNLEAPRILHIATHGFFLQDSDAPAAESSTEDGRAANDNPRIDNPLLRSGLALTGANLPRTGSDDGIMTALEAANLNLWGTKLVTLSACDTAVGVVRNGEGVYGLRRAFFLAGAETLVMSLWPVSDLITRQMMTGYYAGLAEGLGRGAALRRMQLQMLKRKGRAHPFYWASFIQAGEWASLDGRR
jgi:CHAT domain-containing protein